MSDQRAIDVWREKLEDLRKAEAICANPSQKFELKKQIEEAKEKISELEAETIPGLWDGLLDLARSACEYRRNWTIEDELYIPRAEVDHQMRERLAQGLAQDALWISLEGEAGTGKTTFVNALHEQLLAEAQRGGDTIPLFVDCTCLGGTGGIDGTPLERLARFCETSRLTVWDVTWQLAQRLRTIDRRLIVLVDAIDVALLSDARSRVVRWLAEELHDAGAIVVSTCRPIEANVWLPPRRKPLVIGDFDRSEALRAIDRYVAVFYRELTPAQRNEALRSLHGYLTNPNFADICRRPVTLRMLFEAYRKHPPGEALNRSQLFGNYWDIKVRGKDVDRLWRSLPGDREDLVAEVAVAMVRANSVRLLAGDMERLATRKASYVGAIEDLRSEGVLDRQGQPPHCWFAFFHQSFLEYAAARALVQTPDSERHVELRRLLEPLKSAGSRPWFALLEELAIQGLRYVAGRDVGYSVLHELLGANVPGARASAAAVWCNLPEDGESPVSADQVFTDTSFRHACLEHMHNAAPERIEKLLHDFAIAAWNSGANNQQFAAMECWARTAPLATKAVQRQLEQLRVERFVMEDKAIGNALRGAYFERLGKIYAAFLGANDEIAIECLSRLYHHLRDTNRDVALRAKVVEEVGARAELTSAAVRLLSDWVVAPERPNPRSIKELRDAFGEALLRVPLSDARLAWERQQVLAEVREDAKQSVVNDARARILAVWRSRIVSQMWTVSEVVWPCFLAIKEYKIIGDLRDLVIFPLARAKDKELFNLLVALVEATTQAGADKFQAVRRSCALKALSWYASVPELAHEILERTRLDNSLGRSSTEELDLLAECLVALPSQEHCQVFERLARSGEALRLLQATAGEATDVRVGRLVNVLIESNLKADDLARFAKELGRVVLALPRDVLQRAIQRLVQAAKESAQEARRSSLGALPVLLMSLDSEEVTRDAVRTVRTAWTERRRDAEAAWIGIFLADVLRFWNSDGRIRDQLWRDAFMICSRHGTKWREARKSALSVIEELVRVEGERRFADVDRLMQAVGTQARSGVMETDDLMGLARICYRTGEHSGEVGWKHAEAVARLAEECGLGRGGKDNIGSALTGTVRRALRDGGVRRKVLIQLEELPGFLQVEVVRCAKDDDDDEFFGNLQARRLELRSKHILESWGRMRSSKAAISR